MGFCLLRPSISKNIDKPAASSVLPKAHYRTERVSAVEKVHIKIQGIQIASDQTEEIMEQLLVGEYAEKNGSHYLFYEEDTEGAVSKTKCRLKYKGHALELVKQGALNTEMLLEAGKCHEMMYRTSFGDLLLEVETEYVSFTKGEEEILIETKYRLVADDEPIMACRLIITISRA